MEGMPSCLGKDRCPPLTKACLNDKKAWKLIGDGDDEYEELIHIIQDTNNLAMHTLDDCRYDGSTLKGKNIPAKWTTIAMEENSLESHPWLARATMVRNLV